MRVNGVQNFQGGGAAELGAVMPSPEEIMMSQMQPEAAIDPAQELESAIEGLQIQRSQTEDHYRSYWHNIHYR